MRLKDKTALITGAGSGIGQAIAQLFAREGARIVGADLDGERIRVTADQIQHNGGKALAVQADVTQWSHVQRMVNACMETFGPPDILINNVGGGKGDQGLLKTEMEDWEALIERNLKSMFLCCRAVVPEMIQSGHGSVVNISSLNGIRGLRQPTYSAAKGGVNAMTAAFAMEYASYGIRFNVVCPGSIETPAWDPVLQHHPRIREEMGQIYPLGRMGKPEDVAYAALYLASDEASFVTGIVLPVDGGISSGVGKQLPQMTTRWMREAGAKKEA